MNIKNWGLQKYEVANELYEDRNVILNEETEIKMLVSEVGKWDDWEKMGIGADVTKVILEKPRCKLIRGIGSMECMWEDKTKCLGIKVFNFILKILETSNSVIWSWTLGLALSCC